MNQHLRASIDPLQSFHFQDIQNFAFIVLKFSVPLSVTKKNKACQKLQILEKQQHFQKQFMEVFFPYKRSEDIKSEKYLSIPIPQKIYWIFVSICIGQLEPSAFLSNFNSIAFFMPIRHCLRAFLKAY